jgi:O-antigen ligase
MAFQKSSMSSLSEAKFRIKPNWLITLFGIFAFWTYESAFFILVRPAASATGEFRASDPVARAANIAVLLGALCLAAWTRGFPRYLLRHAKLPGLIILYCFCSALWSIDPAVTARRSVSLATCFLFGYLALVTYGPRGTIRLYGWSLFLAAVASWAALPIFHAKVFDNDELLTSQALRTFHGVFTQKNELSVEMLMGFCCWAYLGILTPKKGEIERFIWPLAIVAILSAMVYAKGTTSILAVMVASVAVAGLRWRSWRFRLVLYALVAAASLVLVTVVIAEPKLLFAALGKDSSMTGRLPLWIEAARAIVERPILGWGYNAFWSADSIPAQYIWQRIGWPAPNAHNGLLELGLDFGLIGGALYGFMMLRIAVRALRALGQPGFPEAKYLVLVLIAMLVENIDEGTVGWPDALSIITAFWYAITSVWCAGAWPVPLRSSPHRVPRPPAGGPQRA